MFIWFFRTMLNYKQLHHFWNVARAGGIARASERSGLAPQTLSGQIAALESSLGATLFKREGRRLVLTETGQVVLAYAEEIFRAGAELEEAVAHRLQSRAIPFRVGIADVVPKSIAWLLLAPCMRLGERIRIHCREDKFERLLGDLAIHKLDLVLADSPMPTHMDVRGHSQKLIDSPVSLFGTARLAATLHGDFPASLDRMPLLLPGSEASIRQPLLHWFERQRVTPQIVGEFDDSALMKSFGQAGVGLFPAPDLIADQICRQYDVVRIGPALDLIDSFYAITVNRRTTHPATLAICKPQTPG